MAYDKFFGFDLTQRKTLEKMFDELVAGDTTAIEALQDEVTALQGEVGALDTRVTALEDAAE